MTDIAAERRQRVPEATKATLADREVIEGAKAGDHQAFRVLVERYQGRACGLALRVLRDEDKARDAVQEAFLKVYTAIHKFEGRSSFGTWLHRLVFNLCLDMKRRDRSDRHVEWNEERAVDASTTPSSADPHPSPSTDFEPAEALQRKELRGLVARAIDTLPDSARETLVLREVEGLSYAEIGSCLGIPKGTVMSRLHYARRRVQAALQEAGFAADEEGAAVGAGEDGP